MFTIKDISIVQNNNDMTVGGIITYYREFTGLICRDRGYLEQEKASYNFQQMAIRGYEPSIRDVAQCPSGNNYIFNRVRYFLDWLGLACKEAAVCPGGNCYAQNGEGFDYNGDSVMQTTDANQVGRNVGASVPLPK